MQGWDGRLMTSTNKSNNNSIAKDFEHWIMIGLILAVILATVGTMAKDFYSASDDTGGCASASADTTKAGRPDLAPACAGDPA